MPDEAWARLLHEALAALSEAHRLAGERPAGSAEQAAAAMAATRLEEFCNDLRVATRRGRTDPAPYRSVLEQIRTTYAPVAGA